MQAMVIYNGIAKKFGADSNWIEHSETEGEVDYIFTGENPVEFVQKSEEQIFKLLAPLRGHPVLPQLQRNAEPRAKPSDQHAGSNLPSIAEEVIHPAA
jgi:hypothetical protein